MQLRDASYELGTWPLAVGRKILCLTAALVFSLIIQLPCLAQTNSVEVSEGKVYNRIISLYSAHTENLVSMGAADQLVGISPADNYPEYILDKKRFSYREDPERFIAARPDLIIVRPMIERSYPQLMAKLREVGIDIISLQPTSADEIFSYWRELGKLSGHEQEAEVMIENFTSRLNQIKSRVDQIPAENRPGVYFESIHRKMKTFASESISLFALEQAGGRNVATDASQVRNTNIAAYSKERILAKAQEIDVFIAQRGRMNPVDIETIRNETGFQAIKAVRNNNIILIDEELVSRPTMRLIEGITELHSRLYPREVVAKGDRP
jgi:iron complex transport system substrate-binding protein